VLYHCILTGAEDGLGDVDLPLSGIYSRLYSGEPSDHQVTVPFTIEIAEAIDARPNGTIRVFQAASISASGDGGERLVCEFAIDRSSYHRGAYSASYTLAGSRQTTNATPITVTVDALFEEGRDFNGGRTWKVPAYYGIRPGDSAVIDGDTHLIDRVQFHASPTDTYLTLRESA
jgi:hypothetical protein